MQHCPELYRKFLELTSADLVEHCTGQTWKNLALCNQLYNLTVFIVD